MSTRIQSNSHLQAALPAEGGASLISDTRLVEIYTAMLECRMLRETACKFAGRPKLRKLASGTEAVAAAALIGLEPGDLFISANPQPMAAMLKGVPLASILRALQMRTNAGSDDKQAHICAGVLVASSAGRVPRGISAGALAAGTAFAARHGNRKNVAIAFYEGAQSRSRDGANAENSWREAFHFALGRQLPLILIRQSARPFLPASRRRRTARRAPGCLPIIPVDANDAVAVYRVAQEAIAHARRGSGPTLIDCVPLRVAGERKQDFDCIARMERCLRAKGLRPERVEARTTQKFNHAFDAAVTSARREARKVVKSGRTKREIPL